MASKPKNRLAEDVGDGTEVGKAKEAPLTRRGLILVQSLKVPLSKPQLAFNRLVRRIEKLRRQLVKNAACLDEDLAFYVSRILPLEKRLTPIRKALVRLLFPFLSSGQLKGKQARKELRGVIVVQLEEIQAVEGTLAEEDLHSIYREVRGASVDPRAEMELEAMKGELKQMFATAGVDVDLSEFKANMPPEEAARIAAELMDRLQQANAAAGTASKCRPKSARASEKEARERAAAELRNRNLSQLYKQLAKLLHPDLERDPGQREAKEAAMKQLTTAYKKQDLHALLKLELEWIHRQQADVENLTDEKLALYNSVLKQQVAELEQELGMQALHLRYAPIQRSWGPFGLPAPFDGPGELRDLRALMKEMQESVRRLEGKTDALAEVRAIVAAQQDGFLPADLSCPF